MTLCSLIDEGAPENNSSTMTLCSSWMHRYMKISTCKLHYSVADPGMVPRVPGHHPKIQGYTTKLLTSHRSSQLLQESLHT